MHYAVLLFSRCTRSRNVVYSLRDSVFLSLNALNCVLSSSILPSQRSRSIVHSHPAFSRIWDVHKPGKESRDDVYGIIAR